MSERKLEITDKTLVILDLIYRDKIRKRSKWGKISYCQIHDRWGK